MNQNYSNYLLFEKAQVPLDNVAGALPHYTRFVSAYNTSDRIGTVFKQVPANERHWLLLPEYGHWATPPAAGETAFSCTTTMEDEAIKEYLQHHPLTPGTTLCVDITGFLRPHIMYLLRQLYESNWSSVDLLYAEPIRYVKGSHTPFSGDVSGVRQVRGYEGVHTTDTDDEYLVVGCSYDVKLMSAVANSRLRARKIQMFPFPALRPHMYQENRVRTQECQNAFGAVGEILYAPAHDPFATAHVLSNFVLRRGDRIKNLYLSPLATKPQVIGFALYYLMECLDKAVSITFPFSSAYNQETSEGISELWRYRIDLDLIRSLNH